jgi:hypothetical protein
MTSVTLAESAKLAQDELVAGVIETVITVNRMYEVMPFTGISGNALAYNRENVPGDSQVLGVGGTITAKAPASFTKVTSELTTILGDAEVNGLIQSTRSSDGNDQTAIQVASKAKSCGRQFQDMLINGDGTGDTFAGLLTLCAGSQILPAAANGSAISFETLDALMDSVVDKDGEVDYFAMNARTIRSFNSLLRALGGASISDVITLPSGKTVPAYRGVPMFRNDYIPLNQVRGTSSNCTSVLCGTFDDGSRSHGFAGLTSEQDSGMQVVDVGESHNKDEHITRVKWYAGLALFNEKGLAIATGITN